jgi:hypothetical protein
VKTWPAILVAPMLALTDQSVAYVLVPWSCSHQAMLWPSLTHAAFLLATLATLLPLLRDLRLGAPPSSPDEQGERRQFLALTGSFVAAFSALVIAAMWAMHGFIPACVS